METSRVCPVCPTCGSSDVKTRLVTPMVGQCICRACRYIWTVAIERAAD